MKSFLPFVTIALVFSSCTAAYNSGQTPDDVYFSPQRLQDEYVRMETKKDRYRYDRSDETEDDRYLRMKVRNRRMWSDLDYYYNDPIAYNYYYHRDYNYYNNYYSSPWNLYNSWNYYHNPYSMYNPYGYGRNYGKQVYVGGSPSRQQQINTPRRYNLNVYDRNNNAGSPRLNNTTDKNRVYRSSNSNPSYNTPSRDAGSSLRNVFGNSTNSSSSNNNSTPVRVESSSNSSSNSNSSGSSRSGSTAPVRKF